MPGRPYVLTEAALASIKDSHYEVALLPWGATEPHNLHLPFGTDSVQAEAVAIESARLAWDAGARVIVLPTIPVGANAQQLSTPFTLNLDPSTQARVLADIVHSLDGRTAKLLVLNGHGGNDFKQVIRELQPRTSLFLCAANWYTAAPGADFFAEPGDHAGELETSVMLHLTPDLVLPLSEAGDGSAKAFRIEGLRSGLAWAPRDWAQVTADTGVGDPSRATAEKGRAFFEVVTAKLAAFLVELAAADLEDLYE